MQHYPICSHCKTTNTVLVDVDFFPQCTAKTGLSSATSGWRTVLRIVHITATNRNFLSAMHSEACRRSWDALSKFGSRQDSPVDWYFPLLVPGNSQKRRSSHRSRRTEMQSLKKTHHNKFLLELSLVSSTHALVYMMVISRTMISNFMFSQMRKCHPLNQKLLRQKSILHFYFILTF